MRQSYCIVCGSRKDGIEIREDHVIDLIRWFNRTVLRTPPRDNRIVVCSSCYPKYETQRKRYLSRQRTYFVLGALFVIFAIIVASNKIEALLIGIGICALLYVFSLLSYMPDLKYDGKPGGKGRPGRQPKP
ncbi:MAG TPA: hypothetical protein VL945_02290 [Candidatus Saccharimonadales bacterium]|nr:hypothetical protein [Candidatus Saccharimonadales bacterium]